LEIPSQDRQFGSIALGKLLGLFRFSGLKVLALVLVELGGPVWRPTRLVIAGRAA
jgi:hypothetical protein